MPRASETVLVDGPAGPLQTLIDEPETLCGLALVAQSASTLGWRNSNKCVHAAHCCAISATWLCDPIFVALAKVLAPTTMARARPRICWSCSPMPRRWDASRALPVILAGYSFGAFVQTRVAKRLVEGGRRPSN